MDLELPRYIRTRRTHTKPTISKKARTRRLLKPNATGIVYFLVLSHGSIFEKRPGEIAKNTGLEDGVDTESLRQNELKMTKIPKKMQLFNKLTYTLFGHPNFTTEQMEKDQIKEYTRRFAEFNEPGSSPLIGDDLKEFIQKFETYKSKLKFLQNAEKNDGMYEMRPLISRPKSLFQVSLNNTYTNKIFMRNPGMDYETTDILVVFAKGGTKGKQFEIGEKILKNRKRTRSYGIRNGQVITLKELLNMSLNRGYNKVVMIDYSCETCYQIDEDAFTPSYEYINAEDETPGKILEKMPLDRHPIADKLAKESDKMQNNKFELEDRLKELEKEEQELVEDIKRLKELEEDGEEELVEYIKRLKELEEEKPELVENMKRLETQIDEKLSELDIMREIEEKEWNERYETSDGKYQYMKQKQGTKITDPATLLKLELELSRKKTRG